MGKSGGGINLDKGGGINESDCRCIRFEDTSGAFGQKFSITYIT